MVSQTPVYLRNAFPIRILLSKTIKHKDFELSSYFNRQYTYDSATPEKTLYHDAANRSLGNDGCRHMPRLCPPLFPLCRLIEAGVRQMGQGAGR